MVIVVAVVLLLGAVHGAPYSSHCGFPIFSLAEGTAPCQDNPIQDLLEEDGDAVVVDAISTGGDYVKVDAQP